MKNKWDDRVIISFIDFHVNNGTKMAITLGPLTLPSPPTTGERIKVRGM